MQSINLEETSLSYGDDITSSAHSTTATTTTTAAAATATTTKLSKLNLPISIDALHDAIQSSTYMGDSDTDICSSSRSGDDVDDGINTTTSSSNYGRWDHNIQPFQLPRNMGLVLGDIAHGSSTEGMVRKVMTWRKENINQENQNISNDLIETNGIGRYIDDTIKFTYIITTAPRY